MQSTALKPKLLDVLGFAHEQQQTFLQALNENEQNAIGTATHWAIKDHLVHTTIWIQRLLQQIVSARHGEEVPHFQDFEKLNEQNFAEQRHRPFADIHREAQLTYADLIINIQELSEEDLTNPARASWLREQDDGVFPEGRPLWDAIVITAYAHIQEHLAQFYLDRHDLERATRIWETWVDRLTKTDMPPILNSIALYNLACFYATHNQIEKAPEVLRQALQLNPNLLAFSQHDPDLAVLHNIS
jgi:tetratricopeptide (TPR) repeat protein